MMSQSSCHHPATTNDPFSSIGLPWLALGLVFDADLRYQILSRTGTQIIPAARRRNPVEGEDPRFESTSCRRDQRAKVAPPTRNF